VIVTGGVVISSTADSSAATNGGALTIAGGLAVSKKVVTGGQLSVAATTTSTSSTTGALVSTGGIAVASTTDASSTTNGGAVTVAGGVAVAKSLYANNLYATGQINRQVATLARRHSTTQNTSSGVDTVVLFDTATSANSQGTTGFSYSAGQFTYSGSSDVLVHVSFRVTFAVTSTVGIRLSYVKINGSGTLQLGKNIYAANTSPLLLTTSNSIFRVSNGDYFECIAYQTSAGAVIAISNSYIQITIL
jgi:hypothetical protein